MSTVSTRFSPVFVIGSCLLLAFSASILLAEDAAKVNPADEPAEEKDEIDEILAGHSYHGDVFNEGPRQKAYLMSGTGHVKFPVTTKDPLAQKFFEQGIGQLYGFWDFEAERSFRHAAALDPDCAMAYWGAAMANLRNDKRSKGFIEEAVERKDKADAREVMYIEALEAYITAKKDKRDKRNDAYTKAVENIILKFPNDLEAKAFLALHLYQSRKSSTSYFAVNALLEDIFDVEPMHSAHHFRIHLWDHRKPEQAVSSAVLCGQASPSIAHMWHMPGHIFSRLKRYDDAAWQQEASARVDHAHMMRDRVMPDQISNFAHNNEWFIRNLIHVGRVHDAVDLAKNMTELPRHPKYNTFDKRGSASFGRQRLFQVLRTYELWDDLIALAKTPYLEPTEDEDEQIKRLRYLGLAYFQTGDIAGGNAQIAELQRRLDATQAERDKTVKTAEEKAAEEKVTQEKKGAEEPEEGEEAKKDEKKKSDDPVAKVRKKFSSKITKLEKALNALKGHLAVANDELQTGYDLLKKAGGVEPLHLLKVQWQSGDKDKALEAIRKNVKSNKNEVQPLSGLVEMLWKSDKKEEAKEVFEELRALSAPIDLDVVVFSRLTPIALELGYPEDWRVSSAPAADIGERPELDTLGPFRWQPSPSYQWTLNDSEGKLRSSADFKGKPHVVIFYLGYACLHCAEQLQAFAPKAKEFEEAGISMIAISTDDQKGLKTSIDNYGDEEMPIPLVANAELDVFKTFRVYDDFEKQALHGTFIIDGSGKVLWKDISYEPFMDPDFVLKEAKRLLTQTPQSE